MRENEGRDRVYVAVLLMRFFSSTFLMRKNFSAKCCRSPYEILVEYFAGVVVGLWVAVLLMRFPHI